MKIYSLALLWYIPFICGLVFQFPFTCDESLEFKASLPTRVNQQNQKRDETSAANIVFKSTDGGQTWQDISTGLPIPLKVDETGGREVFFADDNGVWFTDGNGIYHSNPNSKGPIWDKEILPNEYTSIAPGKGGIFTYNYRGGGIFKKSNGTGVWSPVFTNLPAKRVLSITVTAGGTIFIGSDRGLFKSTNSGTSWKQLNAPTNGKIVEADGVLVASSQQGIVRSTDEGENWALVIGEGGVGIDVEPIDGGFVAINYSTVAKTRRIRTSYNGGKTWQAIDEGFPGQVAIDLPWRFIKTGNSAQGSSTDSGWRPKDATPLVQEYKTSVIQLGNNFFCGHTDGIYKSSDKGKTWKLVHPSLKGKMFILSVSNNVIYALQTASHC